jgi:hypothetical protein
MSADDRTRSPNGSDPSALQFDVAESATTDGTGSGGAQSCAQCAASIVASYYEVNGLVVCPRCRGTLDTGDDGSRARRLLAAAGLGLLAAVGGSLVYFAIAALTGYEFGLVAIAVGFVVGKAVHRGSRGRGGWAYQTLAVLLTYFAIVSTYIPLAVREFRANPTHADSLRTAIAKPDGGARADSLDEADDDSTAALAAGDSGLAVAQAGAPAARASRRSGRLGPGMVVVGVLALLAFAAVIPILAGFSNIIGLVIIGFAVFQAWSLNRRAALVVTGPYRVGRDGARAAAGG